MEEKIEITKSEYLELIERDTWLCALEAMGVDNWIGYDEARTYLKEQELENK